MISLNLLPHNERRPFMHLPYLFAIISLLGFVVCSIFYSYGLWQEKIVQERLQRAHVRYELLRPVETVMTTTGQQQAQLTAKKDVLLALTKERLSWYSIFVHLGTITSSTLWLSEVSGDTKEMVIKGKAVHYLDLSRYMQMIAKIPFLSEPALIRSDTDKKQEVTGFELVVKFKPLKELQ